MYFTLLFHQGAEGMHLAYDLVYHPTAVWCKNGEWLVNDGGVSYQVGFLESLLKAEHEIFEKLYTHGNSKNVRIVCHDEGHGGRDCLQNLIQDLTNHGFSPEVISEPTDDVY